MRHAVQSVWRVEWGETIEHNTKNSSFYLCTVISCATSRRARLPRASTVRYFRRRVMPNANLPITITCRIPPAPLVEAHPVGGTPATAQMSARSSVDARRPGAGLKQQARPAPRSAASAAREGRAARLRRARRRRRAQSTRAGRPVATLCSPAVAARPRTGRWSAG